MIVFDDAKNKKNIRKHGIGFTAVLDFEFDTAVTWIDDRFDYGETRWCAIGYIGLRLYHLTFVYRDELVRPISLRKANKREVTAYANT